MSEKQKGCFLQIIFFALFGFLFACQRFERNLFRETEIAVPGFVLGDTDADVPL